MIKQNLPKFLYLISALLLIGFCIRLGVDCARYSPAENSAPLWVWGLVRGIEFLIPAAVALIVAKILKKKGCQKNEQCD